MILYHGSERIVDEPIYGKGSRNNDYGRGFYCTEDEELAKEWACAKNNDGFVNQYEFDMTDLKVLNLNSNNFCLLDWLALLAKNRTYWEKSAVSETAKKYISEYFLVDVSEYDVIIGYRADDSYFSFAQDFVAGAISYRQLEEAMKLGKLGEQIVLISPKAFGQIKYISNTPVEASVYYKKKKERDNQARKDYRQTKLDGVGPDDLLVMDIVRGGMKQNDERLR